MVESSDIPYTRGLFCHWTLFRYLIPTQIYLRYDVSPPFRKLMLNLTIYWTVSSAIYCGVTAAVTWTTSFRFAFGYTLGQLFVWAALSAVGCKYLARKGLRDERKWLETRTEFLSKQKTQETVVWSSPLSFFFHFPSWSRSSNKRVTYIFSYSDTFLFSSPTVANVDSNDYIDHIISSDSSSSSRLSSCRLAGSYLASQKAMMSL